MYLWLSLEELFKHLQHLYSIWTSCFKRFFLSINAINIQQMSMYGVVQIKGVLFLFIWKRSVPWWLLLPLTICDEVVGDFQTVCDLLLDPLHLWALLEFVCLCHSRWIVVHFLHEPRALFEEPHEGIIHCMVKLHISKEKNKTKTNVEYEAVTVGFTLNHNLLESLLMNQLRTS